MCCSGLDLLSSLVVDLLSSLVVVGGMGGGEYALGLIFEV